MDLFGRRLWAFAATVTLSGAGVLAACSSSNSGDDSLGPVPDAASDTSIATEAGSDAADPAQLTACQNYVDAYCAKLTTCQGGVTPSCEAMKATCPDLLFGSGSTLAPSDVSSCSVQLAAASCLDFYNDPPASCVKPGTRAAGASCAFSSQCQSARCVDDNAHCGYCARIADDGENCNMAGVVCGPGKWCDSYNTGACAPVPAPGAPCNVLGPSYVYCPQGLDCARSAGQTADQSTCQPRAQAGQPCNVEPGGDFLYCAYGSASCNVTDAAANAGTCIAYGNVGDICGLRSDGVSVQCDSQSGYCRYDDGGDRGTCAPFAAVGAPCGNLGLSSVPCDDTSYCETPIFDEPGTCVARKKAGDDCQPRPIKYVDGGASGGSYGIGCGSDAICTSYYCYFSNKQDGGPATDVCVTGDQRGIVGDSCGHGQCDTCAPSLTCVDHKCVVPDLSSCK